MTPNGDDCSDSLILVTGSSGLIGRALVAKMSAAGLRSLQFDIRETTSPAFGDLRDGRALERAMADVAGVVHLAGVSRVIWGERCPELCWAVNVEATRKILALAHNCRRRPWVVYASSREVYGQQSVLPVAETAVLKPMNVYARSKVAAEKLVLAARDAGLSTAVVRFSSVYGDVRDHADRVVPAFALAATQGGTMRIDGPDCAFDFTHVDDVAAGLMKICNALSSGENSLPTLHFVSGMRTTLRELAEMTAALGGGRTQIGLVEPRAFDISRFCGDPALAAAVLGWRTTTSLRAGLSRLIGDFRSRSQAGPRAAE
jgi:nucleoside-diphosphate-sugar epimerase